MADRYAVIGNPVAHSKSPFIHAAFASQTGQDMVYARQLVPLDGFYDAVASFFRGGGKGLNVTVPFKLEACACADVLSERARLAGAANTLTALAGGGVAGDNTDGIGLLRDLEDNLGWKIAGRRLLVLGAGGAVRGILGPLLATLPAALVVANRTPAKARELAAIFADRGPVEPLAFSALGGRHFDLVINGTSASMAGELPPLPDDLLAPGAACYDLMYGATPTPFLQWAAAQAVAHMADGLGMLVEQAAESFFVWRNVRPQTRPVIDALRRELGPGTGP